MAYVYGWGRNKGKALEEAQIYNTAPTELTGIYKPRFEMGLQALTPQFQGLRGQASDAMGLRGLGRTSMYANAMSDITGKQMQAQQALYGSMMEQAAQESMQRDFQSMAQSRFNAELREKARQYDENMRWQDYFESERSNEAKRAANRASRQAGWEQAGSLASSLASSAAYLFLASDKRIKEDIKKIDNALDIIMKLKPKKYKYKWSNKKTYGVIAQDVEKVAPGLVVNTRDSIGNVDNVKAVDVYGLVGLLIKAVQELKERID